MSVTELVSEESVMVVDYSKYFDMAALLSGDMPPAPTPEFGHRDDGHAVFYREQVNLLFGDPECGKTWVALAAAREALRLGDIGRVLVLDLDHNGPAPTVQRLLALGVDASVLADPERFLYVEPEEVAQLGQVIADMKIWAPDVAVIDSLGELIPMFGSSSNSADDFTAVHTRVLKPLAMAGACVILIDHLAKNSDSRAFGPGGTGAKRRAIGGTSLRVRVKDAFTPGRGGSAYLTINKDRHGGLRQHCPSGDREALAGTFKLLAFTDGILEATIEAPKDGEFAPQDFSITGGADPNKVAADVAALDALVPPPKSVRDVKERMNWRTDRAGDALRMWRNENGE
ncbi:AAA family ATPase [Prescottella equi]|uniref:AAA family ATPase n=1 Tax=Rhodococcus hoagii TaxID=43767 RepID=UPI001C79A895|nr:AAA family ATPase [Prescottella equi]BCN82779.1 hypothetical protein RE0356_14200 [Prescottella equi]